jgi:colanic acid biosynthesis glycosyl transferase WcaI
MRILVHDCSGHPFQVQLSRALARRGNHVLHVYCPSYGGAKGSLGRRPDDPDTFNVVAVNLDGDFQRYSYLRRILQEFQYARRFIAAAQPFAPDVVISGNTPLFAQWRILSWCRRHRFPFVFWLQDVYGIAMAKEAGRLIPAVGSKVGEVFQRLEGSLLRRSDAVVCITSDFLNILREFGVPADRVRVIENWAPIDELPVLDSDNGWAREHLPGTGLTLLYAGTLGRKHDPNLLWELARGVADWGAQVIVASEGLGATWLEDRKRQDGAPNLQILDYQPYDRLPEMIASADVLLVLLEADAGIFSVPSKILTYLCAGRPILAAMPSDNLGASIIEKAAAGIVTPPGDAGAFVHAARRLLDNAELRESLGRSARSYAERTFVIDRIADDFLAAVETAKATRLAEDSRR